MVCILSLGHLYELQSPSYSFTYDRTGIIHMINGLILNRSLLTLLAETIKK